MKFSMRRTAVLLLGMGISAVTFADDSVNYQQGMKAFRSGDFQGAVQHFQTAQSQGLNSATLHYNLGASYYRLGHYDQAAEQFGVIRNDGKWGALAEYNLGLIAEKQNDSARARTHFQQAYQKADSAKVMDLALAKLNGPEQPDKSGSKRWNGYLSVAAGYDDNPALTELEQTETAIDGSDTFAETLGVVSGYLTGDRQQGTRVNAGFYNRTYSDMNQFSVAGIYGGLYRDRQYQQWLTTVGVTADNYWVDGDQYTSGLGLLAQGSTPVAIGKVDLKNQLSFIRGADEYSYLDGLRNRLTISWIVGDMNRQWRLGYINEYNNRDDVDVPPAFQSYSPVRHALFGQVTQQLTQKLSTTARLEYRDSTYQDEDVTVEADGSLTEVERNEDRLEASLVARYDLSRVFGLFAEYRYTDNDSNLARYAYQSNQLMVGLDAAF